MAGKQLVLALAVSVSVLCAVAAAEAQAPPLTNPNVAAMIKSGLPESSIVHAIELAGRRGAVAFDTSPAALIELKQAGATEAILNALLSAQAEKAFPGLPEEAGVYYRTPSGWMSLESSVFWPSFAITEIDRKPRDVAAPGPEPRVRIADNKPVFYARDLTRGQQWQLLKVTEKDGKRRVRVRLTDPFPRQIQFDRGQVTPVAVTAAAGDVFTIAPAAALAAGGYLLCSTMPAAPRAFNCYSFAVTQ